MSNAEIYVVSAVRSAIGGFGGSLKDLPLADLASAITRAAIERSGVAASDVGHVVMGTVIPTEPRDAYLSRVASMNAGVPKETPAFNVNRLCGSGLQAIVSAAQTLLLGDTDVALAAGAESMSRGPYLLPQARWGARMGDLQGIDYTVGVLQDPFEHFHMGITAENVAAQHGITREMQDELALTSQRRAARAIAEGRFDSQIVPIELKTRKGSVQFATDEHVRGEVTAEQLAGMKPVFKKDGSVTAGNASSLNDGAAAVLLMSANKAKALGLPVLAKISAYASAGVDPAIMGIGPVSATQRCLDKAGWQLGELDLIEANEAFAAQALAVGKALEWNAERVNVNGGAIALGHPIGASGCRVLVTLLHEMIKRDAKKGLATLCIGGGQGVALAIER